MNGGAASSSGLREFASLVARLPLPMFPVHHAASRRAGAFYHFTEKLLYDHDLRAWALPVLAALFRRRGHVHLLQNAGDLGHAGHRARTRQGLVEYGLLEGSASVVLICDPQDHDVVAAMQMGLGVSEARLCAKLLHHNRLADPALFHVGGRARLPWLHVARLVSEKGHELLLAGLELLRGARPGIERGMVLSTGAGEREDYARPMRDRLVDFGAAVRYRLAQREVSSLLAQARFGVSLSLAEGGCRAVGEYLLAGLPVLSIAGARGGKNLYLGEDNSVLVGATPGEVASGITELTERPRDRERIRERYVGECLPGSYYALMRIAAESAAAGGLVLGPPNLRPVHYLMRATSLELAGFTQLEVAVACAQVMADHVCVRLVGDGGPRLGLNVEIRHRPAGGEREVAVDLARFGVAIVPPETRPRLRVENQELSIDGSAGSTRRFDAHGVRVEVAHPRVWQ